ncbi:hypothetical protein [Paenibacillus sp. N3.4]|uniref:hypothetical protein n=1 Tax=Paenibacillus sp. N3.4 TaxID=2603222 RepID=UPI0011CABB5C|nr:hypothetical protein [Paenibacillus sp. N3.4]TXK67414.1 hypothetical protein FU659_34640 [Paenibacillus sp. N3.4]
MFLALLLTGCLTIIPLLVLVFICYLSIYIARKKKIMSPFLHFCSIILIYLQSIIIKKFNVFINNIEYLIQADGGVEGPLHPRIDAFCELYTNTFIWVIYIELFLILIVFLADLVIISINKLSINSINTKIPFFIVAILFAIAIPHLIFSEFYYFRSNADLNFNKDIPFSDCIYASYTIAYSIPASESVGNTIKSIVDMDSYRFLVIVHILFTKLVEIIVVAAIAGKILDEIKNKNSS